MSPILTQLFIFGLAFAVYATMASCYIKTLKEKIDELENPF